MKKLLTLLLFLILVLTFTPTIIKAGYVRGYTRSNGTYVQPYYRSNPNGLRYDNYSYTPRQPSYNSSYGQYNTYKWNTPSWNTQSDYWSGRSYYNSRHYGF